MHTEQRLTSINLELFSQKIRTRFLAAPGKSVTVEELVRNEMCEGCHTATQGLVWLIRGLLFTSGALKRTQADPNLKLSDAFQESYTGTLKPFHNFIVKGIFSVSPRGANDWIDGDSNLLLGYR